VEITWGEDLLGLRVIDTDGRPLGRVATAYCTPHPLTVVWLVVRAPGLRRRCRAVPAFGACWDDHARTVLRVRHSRAQVLSSPVADEKTLDTTLGRARFEEFYALAPRSR
jgi:hypothetical protein